VAGTWSIEAKRRTATLTLRPLERLSRVTRTALVDEAERLVRALQPDAKGHEVSIER
jgi:DNA glycosylase AlkZ-like